METQNPNQGVPNNTPSNSSNTTTGNSTLPGLEGFFDTYLRIKAPFQLPAGVKEFIVKYGPWITLVVLILAAIAIIPLTLLALGLTAANAPFAVAAGYGGSTIMAFVSIILGIVTLVLEAIAIPKLLKRQLSGWKLVYYAALISALSSLLNLNIISLVLGLLISMYVLFQIREYYK
jgi:hypothetical protein